MNVRTHLHKKPSKGSDKIHRIQIKLHWLANDKLSNYTTGDKYNCYQLAQRGSQLSSWGFNDEFKEFWANSEMQRYL